MSRRVAIGAGFAVAALFVVGLLVAPGAALLDPGLSPETLASAYATQRGAVLTSGWVAGLTWGFAFLGFAGALSALLSERGAAATTWAFVGLAGAAVESLAILVVILCSQLAAHAALQVGPATVFALHQGALLANNLSGFPTIVCVVAYSIGLYRIGSLPPWGLALAALCIATHLGSTLGLASEGLAAPSGPLGLAAPFTMTSWVLGVAVALRGVR